MSPRKKKTEPPLPPPAPKLEEAAHTAPAPKAADEGEDAMAAALEEVIARLQHLMRETMQRADDEEKFAVLADYMEKFSRASTRLAALLKARQETTRTKGKKSKMQVTMDEVLGSLGKKVE
jgi:nicotinamide mononucleotide adenylyltransferase